MKTTATVKFYRGTHEDFIDIEGYDMNYVTCSSEQQAMNYIYKFEEVDKDKIVDHVRVTTGIYGEEVYYVYYKYVDEEES